MDTVAEHVHAFRETQVRTGRGIIGINSYRITFDTVSHDPSDGRVPTNPWKVIRLEAKFGPDQFLVSASNSETYANSTSIGGSARSFLTLWRRGLPRTSRIDTP
jgi:hypothetical protein